MENNQEDSDRLEESCRDINNLKDELREIKATITALGVGFVTIALSVGFGVPIKTAVWFALGGTFLSYFCDIREK